MKKNKLLILGIIFVFVLPFCMAELDINIESYNSITHLAKLKISNDGLTSYSDIKMTINDNYEVPVVDLLTSENCVSIPQIIETGTHKFTLTSKEGETLTKELTFSKTEEQLIEEKERIDRLRTLRKEELAKIAQKTQKKIEKKLSGELEKKEEVEDIRSQIDKKDKIEESPSKKKYLLLLLIPLIVLLAVFINYMKKKKS